MLIFYYIEICLILTILQLMLLKFTIINIVQTTLSCKLYLFNNCKVLIFLRNSGLKRGVFLMFRLLIQREKKSWCEGGDSNPHGRPLGSKPSASASSATLAQDKDNSTKEIQYSNRKLVSGFIPI